MKFAAVLVVLATAVTASSAQQIGIFGWNPYFGAYPGFGYAPRTYLASPPPPAASFEPDAEFLPGAAPAAPAFPPGTPFAGNYVAANRGSVHAAPLVGHTQSVRSFNTDPAPGTF